MEHLIRKGNICSVIIHHRYLSFHVAWDFTAKKGASYFCQSLVKALGFLKEGFRWTLGHGNSSLWYDAWSNLGSLGLLVDFVHF